MFSERIERLSGSLIREILSLTQRPGMISFAGGLPASHMMPCFDFTQLPAELRQYGPSEGEPILREKIAEHVRQLGIQATAEQVLVLSGSQQALDLVAKLFIDPGTPMLVEAPTYLAALQNFKLFGADLHELPLSAAGIDPEQLRQTAQRTRPACCYLIPTFQNPSGYCYSPETRAAVSQVLDDLMLPLIEDEPYRELAYDAVERRPLCAGLKQAPFIYCGSFSKTATPGLRVGYLVASPKLMPYLIKLKQAADLHTNRVGQYVLAKWLDTPDYHAHIATIRQYYRQQRDTMIDALNRHCQELAEWETPPGGLFIWARLRKPLDTREILKTTMARNVAFMPGEPFFATPVDTAGCIRLNFSHASADAVEQGIAIIKDALQDAFVNLKS
ncbi:DNA-binding transcriptional MocR family regulator [Chitinivorax tropicus]|uniref:DNA-binding transcriptional MocR family regulator n=1 Tax=Chitinivorax tropicus TaxID=714531 RepID=A0A840MN53_9PROT|nr:PLP-dependent aminotransferase family protein [Chitinivorax tropicus]MBB5018895.1 DNA-binding transcriptional MocR family regulator [Chitinivorax tropicus]